MSIKLEAGQWYRLRGGEIGYAFGRMLSQEANYPFRMELKGGQCFGITVDGRYNKYRHENSFDVVEHLPDCDSFTWEPPKPIEPPEGWRLLTEGELILVTDIWFDGEDWSDIQSDSLNIGKSWDEKRFHPVARKIEPKYRPFANAEEFKINLDDNHYLILNVMVKCKNPS